MKWSRPDARTICFLVAGVLGCLVFLAVQISSPYIIGADGHFHGYLAQKISESGFPAAMENVRFSWFFDRFSDKDFLYHLYQIPLIFIFGSNVGVKIGALGGAVLLVAAFLATLSKLPGYLVISGMVLLTASPQFLRDMSEARPFTIAVALTLIGIDSVIRKKPGRIFFVALFYGMFHLSAWVFIVYTVCAAVVVWASDRSDWKAVWFSLAGFFLSFLLHPNFPNNLYFWYLNGILVPFYAARGGVLELGAEFFPVVTREIIYRYPGLLLFFPLVMAAANTGFSGRKPELKSWGLAFLVYGFLGLFSQRNITHAYPLAVIVMIYLAGEIVPVLSKLTRVSRDRWLSLTGLFLGISVLAMWFITFSGVKNFLLSDRIFADHFSRVASYIKQHIPPGERIFHANWSDSQYLIGLAGEYGYLVTMDPIYMYTYDPELYRLYREISFGNVDRPASVMVDRFGTRYGYAGKQFFSKFIGQIGADPEFRIMAEDELGVVFQVTGQ